jgi:CO/xanthine dehydrogenase FAD-binding subunit
VGEAAAAGFDPIEDLNGGADYKRQLVRVLMARALAEALPEAA